MDAAVEKGGAGGETKPSCGHVDKGSARRVAWDGLRIEVTLGSARSWDRPLKRSYLVRLRHDDLAVIVAWGLSHKSADCVAERLAELLSLGGRLPGRPTA